MSCTQGGKHSEKGQSRSSPAQLGASVKELLQLRHLCPVQGGTQSGKEHFLTQMPFPMAMNCTGWAEMGSLIRQTS